MGSRAYDASKPTVYLDHSTLVDAFKAHRPDTKVDVAYRPLKEWVERVAAEANLCLSAIHLVELGAWGDDDQREAMARWYGTLPIVWLPLIQHVQEDEDEYWTKVAVGVTDRMHPFVPFSSSLETAFRTSNKEGIAAINRNGEPEVDLVAVAAGDVWRHRWEERYAKQYIAQILEIAENHRRVRATPGWTDEMGRRDVAANFEESIRQASRLAAIRLGVKKDAEFAESPVEGERITDKVIEFFEQNPRCFPLRRAAYRFTQGNADMVDAGDIKDGVPSGKMLKTLRSGFGDYVHLSGSAYCNVVTCDWTVSKWLGDLRKTLGLRPQLTVKGHGGAGGFVRDVMSTWP